MQGKCVCPLRAAALAKIENIFIMGCRYREVAMATEISFPPAALRSEEALRELSRCLWIAPYLSAFESRPFFRASAPWAIMRSQVG